MTWNFGDSFDLYTAANDLIAGYWDTGNPGVNNSLTLAAAGRFGTGQYLSYSVNPGGFLVKASNVNDPVHHLVFAYRTSATLTGAGLGAYFTLYDGATAQCSIVFRQDGAIVLTAGGPTGTTLATYLGAISTLNFWYGIEIEIVINNTTGSFAVRRNGNTSNDFSATGLNTRASANNYANKLQTGVNANLNAQNVDDFFWQSGASAGAWLGDLRCATRMPLSDVLAQFSKSGPLTLQTSTNIGSTNGNGSANTIYWSPAPGFTAPCNGYVTAMSFNSAAGFAGHVIMALYAGGPGPGALLGTTNVATNPVTGVNNLTFTTPIHVTAGSTYYAAFLCDVAFSNIKNSGFAGVQQFSLANAYSSGFPSAPTGLTNNTNNSSFHSLQAIMGTADNAGLVNEPTEDGLATFVFDSNPGDADFYAIAGPPAGSTVGSTVATIARAFVQKSDAGARTGAVQIKSGATTVASSAPILPGAVFTWLWRADVVDPNTSAAWTAAAVSAVQVGPTVVS